MSEVEVPDRAEVLSRVELAHAVWRLAIEQWRDEQVAHADALADHEAQEKERANAQVDGKPFVRDAHVYALGMAAVDVTSRARRQVLAEHQACVDAISLAIRAGFFEEGDQFFSPLWEEPLTVAALFVPPAAEPELGEVTATSDGKSISHNQHPWDLDGDGKPIFDIDRSEWVRFERWWGGGPRVIGWVHPITRRIVETDFA